jgi:xylose isomerase
MAYNLLLKTNAAIEIEESIAYYFLISIELAKKLEAEIRLGFTTICQNPEISQYRYNNKVRIYWLDKFPYGIYYLFENE